MKEETSCLDDLDDSDDHLRWLVPTDLNLDDMGITHLDCVTRVHNWSIEERFLTPVPRYQKQMTLKPVTCDTFSWNKAGNFRTPILCPNMDKIKIEAARAGKCTSFVSFPSCCLRLCQNEFQTMQ